VSPVKYVLRFYIPEDGILQFPSCFRFVNMFAPGKSPVEVHPETLGTFMLPILTPSVATHTPNNMLHILAIASKSATECRLHVSASSRGVHSGVVSDGAFRLRLKDCVEKLERYKSPDIGRVAAVAAEGGRKKPEMQKRLGAT
jgi:hypothetical protein